MNVEFEKKLATACGLYCRLCPEHERFRMGFAETAERLKYLITQMVQVNAWPWNTNDPKSEKEYFSLVEFMKGLQWLSGQKASCEGCMSEAVPSPTPLLPGRNPECKIRSCCFGKGFRFCHECPEFPCEKLTKLEEHYPYCLENLRRMKDIGVEIWLEEQQARVRAGLTNRK